MRFLPPLTLFLGALIAGPMSAAPQPAHTDEAKVAPYTLPDPLVMADGSPVRDAAARGFDSVATQQRAHGEFHRKRALAAGSDLRCRDRPPLGDDVSPWGDLDAHGP